LDDSHKNEETQLKSDLFGRVMLVGQNEEQWIRRDTTAARVWTRPVARWLARREARALLQADGMDGLPTLLAWDGAILDRSWIEGQPMQQAKPLDPAYYRQALTLLRRLHRAGIAHNDLAKEANWLVTPDGAPALVDFQLAWYPAKRGAWFRMLAREDLRHLLKHKRNYIPEKLTQRQIDILNTPSWPARAWAATGKKLYLFVTRKILRWRDREGANDRQFQ
jgi:RIO-like serine/threonine protein kinase